MQEYSHKKETEFDKTILVTAGPTREPLDPIRYISNYSTGVMGYAIAEECLRRGFKVYLISGPVDIDPPDGVETEQVVTAEEMKARIMDLLDKCDCIIMTAAVCDFRPEQVQNEKIKKREQHEQMVLKLKKNPDILAEIGRKEGLIKVGFALETEMSDIYGRQKLEEKELDMIIINRKGDDTDPFGEGNNDYTVMDPGDTVQYIKDIDKRKMAGIIVDKVTGLLCAETG